MTVPVEMCDVAGVICGDEVADAGTNTDDVNCDDCSSGGVEGSPVDIWGSEYAAGCDNIDNK